MQQKQINPTKVSFKFINGLLILQKASRSIICRQKKIVSLTETRINIFGKYKLDLFT